MSAPLESTIQADIRKAVGLLSHVRLWRNNSGVLYDGTGRPVRYGVGQPGGSDLIGLTQIVVTPEMVGRTLAVFTAAEVKRPKAKVPQAQLDFLAFIRDFGGIAGVVRSAEDALTLVAEARVAAGAAA